MTRAFLFPGQGSQAVGMGKPLADAFAAARETFQDVDDALSQKLSRIMWEGPEADLLLTENAQPAIMANAIAVVRVLEKEMGLNLAVHARLVADWDPPQVHARILESQKTRLFLAEVQGSSPRYSNWAYQPFVDESQRFIRGSGGAGPTAVKGRARYPFVAPVQPDKK
jgi:hypothetical protein